MPRFELRCAVLCHLCSAPCALRPALCAQRSAHNALRSALCALRSAPRAPRYAVPCCAALRAA
eukprot:3335382-Lingulodinium_polyedra.AAC.1